MFDNKEYLKKELELLYSKKSELKNFINWDTVFDSDSEFNIKHYSGINNLKRILTPFKLTANYRRNGVERIGNENANIIYVNGICSSIDIAKYQIKFLESKFNQDVELIYNQSDGFLIDVYECMQDRAFQIDSEASQNTAEIILKKVKEVSQLTIIGYSQGGIITASALNQLKDILSSKEKAKITYITFASGAKESNFKDIYSEHFVNTDDPICHLGYFSNKKNYSGTIHQNNTKGHLFIVDYLKKLINGDFGTDSKAFSLINSNENT
jgi:predicted esterase